MAWRCPPRPGRSRGRPRTSSRRAQLRRSTPSRGPGPCQALRMVAGPCGWWSPVRFRAEGGSGPAEQIVQFAVQIDELGLLAGRDDLERAEQEPGHRVQRGLEVRLAER